MADTSQDQRNMQSTVEQDAREAAQRLGLNINDIKGTGTGGKVTKADVEAHAAKTGTVTPSGSKPS